MFFIERREGGTHRTGTTITNPLVKQPAGVAMNTMVTIGGPGPLAARWERLGTVALLKALELVWISMVEDSGEVAESLEVIWGGLSCIGLFLWLRRHLPQAHLERPFARSRRRLRAFAQTVASVSCY